MANKDKKSAMVGIRITPALREKIQMRADKENRSLSQVIEMTLAKAFGSKKA